LEGYGLGMQKLTDHLSPLVNKVTMKFDCENTYIQDMKEFNIDVTLNNKQTRALLRPATTVAKLTIHCVTPKSVDLWWSQQEKLPRDQFKEMPDYVLEHNEKTYYLRNNQDRYLRALVFDDKKQVIFNTTSLEINFFTDHDAKLSFENFGRNDKIITKLLASTGIVYAKVKLEKDTLGNYFYEIASSK
jgi:hypothetical protein